MKINETEGLMRAWHCPAEYYSFLGRHRCPVHYFLKQLSMHVQETGFKIDPCLLFPEGQQWNIVEPTNSRHIFGVEPPAIRRKARIHSWEYHQHNELMNSVRREHQFKSLKSHPVSPNPAQGAKSRRCQHLALPLFRPLFCCLEIISNSSPEPWKGETAAGFGGWNRKMFSHPTSSMW